ncbi:MAG: valine--tRNA ligase [Planctomycetaceae bacterium]|jgi:valyl-tRNA synthetase|nr:valine--tRNA ligase [Planctomycetaceae bacterium]
MAKGYVPAEHEGRIRARWEGSGAWTADPKAVKGFGGDAEPYCILIPPPNVTGALHLGHALNNTLQDILARSQRMRGKAVLWMAGTDHAGIATQAVVERRLSKEQGKRRKDFTREAFVKLVQEWKDEYEARITEQLRSMGCSCDWSRQRFTMDEICARAVREAFFRLFGDGLIYRGKRLVNWDPALQTAVADDECYDEEVASSFWYLRYPLVHASATDPAIGAGPRDADPMPVTWGELAARGMPGAAEMPVDDRAWITVATTRPETYLGDTAVAVNPADPRAKALRGLFVELPLVGRIIPVIEDEYVVLPKDIAERMGRQGDAKDPKAEYASGFLKVTPAHDPNDYELGRKHGLAMINVMAPDGSISDKHGWTDVGDARMLVGKKREEARKLVVKEFETRELLEKVRPYSHTVKHSDRSKAIIEPYLSDQWFCKVTDDRLAGAANRALVPEQRTAGSAGGIGKAGGAGSRGTDGTMRFYPARYARMYEQWHDNIRDWCVSRQLWWGHRIPVWSKAGDSRAELAALTGPDVAVAFDGGTTHACVRVDDAGVIAKLTAMGYRQDEDVLDTWFSSALWPLSTLGWPNSASFAQTAGLLEAFNPTSLLSTAREIITLWVSRMVMMNRYLLGEGGGKGPAPFRDVFIHAVVQDGQGKRMSKSAGNGVDPLDIIESHGSDAMRFTLCTMVTQTQDVRLPVQKDSKSGKNTSPKFDQGRNFCNKLWNAARFAMGMLEQAGTDGDAPVKASELGLIDRWMLSRLAAATAAVDAALNNYEFAEYAQTVYDLLWRDLCDWYLEAIKPTVAQSSAQRAVLAHALETIVRLLHPVTPFVTEAVWEKLVAVKTRPIEGVSLPPSRRAGLLATAGWPTVAERWRDQAAEAHLARLQSLTALINQARAAANVAPKRKVTLHAPAGLVAELGDGLAVVRTLAGLEAIDTGAAPVGGGSGVAAVAFESHSLTLSNLTDPQAAGPADAGAEAARLSKLVEEKRKAIATIEGRLNNAGYIERAPAKLVAESREQLEKLRAELAVAQEALGKLC